MRVLRLVVLLALAVIVSAGGLPTFSTQPPLNRTFVYDGAGAEYTDATHPGVEIRAYVANAADTSEAGSYFDLSEYGSGGWYPATIDTTVSVNIYRIDSAVDSLLESGFVFVGKYAPKGWVTPDAIEADAVTEDKIASVDGAAIVAGTIPSTAYGNQSVPATALQTNAAITNLLSGSTLDFSAGDGSAGVFPDSTAIKVDSLIVYDNFTLENIVTTQQPSGGDDGEFRITSAKFLALGDVDLTSTAQERVTIDGNVVIGDSLTIGAAGDTATVHPVQNGAFRLPGVLVTVGALETAGDIAYPGAVDGMVFIGSCITSGGSTLLLNSISAKYTSPGWISWQATSYGSGTRDFWITGYHTSQ